MTDTRTFVAWRDLVDECERGYDDNVYEYDNDLYIRDLIEQLLSSPNLARHDELTWFRAEVHATDARFRALLHAEPLHGSEGKPWWRAYVPRVAGAELATDLRSSYGIAVDVRVND